jgi:hypothetical protein
MNAGSLLARESSDFAVMMYLSTLTSVTNGDAPSLLQWIEYTVFVYTPSVVFRGFNI